MVFSGTTAVEISDVKRKHSGLELNHGLLSSKLHLPIRRTLQVNLLF
jgi:hypothetical protein